MFPLPAPMDSIFYYLLMILKLLVTQRLDYLSRCCIPAACCVYSFTYSGTSEAWINNNSKNILLWQAIRRCTTTNRWCTRKTDKQIWAIRLWIAKIHYFMLLGRISILLIFRMTAPVKETRPLENFYLLTIFEHIPAKNYKYHNIFRNKFKTFGKHELSNNSLAKISPKIFPASNG